MPRSLSCRSRRLRCERAASSLHPGRYWMMCQAFSRRRVRSRSVMDGSSCTSTASRTWQIVQAGFFFPELLCLLDEEQQAGHRQDQMTHDRHVSADFELVHSQLAFGVLEEPFDVTAAARDEEQGFDGGVLGGVGEEVFHFPGQDVACDDQPAFVVGQAIVRREESHGPDLPDDGPFPGVLDVKRLPGWAAALPADVPPPPRSREAA